MVGEAFANDAADRSKRYSGRTRAARDGQMVLLLLLLLLPCWVFRSGDRSADTQRESQRAEGYRVD